MGTRIKAFSIIGLIYISIINGKCRPHICGDGDAPTFGFSINNATVYPDEDSIAVGDTLWLEIEMPTSLPDNISGTIVDFSRAENLGDYTVLAILTGGSVSDPGESYANESFDYIVSKGKPGQTAQFGIRNFSFDESNGHYDLKVGIIPKNKGIYDLGIGDAANVNKKELPCKRAAFVFAFANTNQHLYFYQNNRPGYIITPYDSAHNYLFRVY